MPEPDNLSPDRVAELQKQLSDAAAQVAKVQAELAAAKGDEPPPLSTPTGPPANGVLYGEPTAPGAASTPTGPGPQVVDLRAILGPEMAAQVRDQLSQLSQFGLDSSQFAGVFGDLPGHGEPPTPTVVDRLADPPRNVPLSFRLSSFFALSWWEMFSILMVLVAPIAVWGFFPWTIPAAFILGILTIVVLRGRRYLLKVGLLKWGKVATVTNADEISRGTYYSGTTYQNMMVRQANGWDVTKRWYSGPASKTKIKYSLDGAAGELTLRGLPFNNGVILANSRKPQRALCVSSFPFNVKPEATGQFGRSGLTPWNWLGICFTILVHVALVAGAWYAVDGLWVHLPG
jgi:hypothetical protein